MPEDQKWCDDCQEWHVPPVDERGVDGPECPRNRRDKLLHQDWSESWETLPEAPPLVPAKVPWHYRFGLTNWLMAKPWRSNYRAIWNGHTRPWPHPLVHLWRTISFPHVHHSSEDDDA